MVWVILVIAVVFCFSEYLYEYYRFFAKYNQTPLDIKTFDGSNQPFHPSVIFVDKGWNGFRYWMAETPYPIGGKPYRDRWECPTIHVSNDGYNWAVPGELRPIDDLTAEEIQRGDYFSDPHLVFKEDGSLECFYRLSSPTKEKLHTRILRKTSNDGISWKNREVLIDLMSDEAINTVGYVVSPAILYEEGKYCMWYVDAIHPFGPDKHICLSTSVDGYQWSKLTKCVLKGPYVNPWHIDVTNIDGLYYLTIYDIKELTIWKSFDGKTFTYLRTLISPAFIRGCFYSEGLYRSSLVKTDEDLKFFFSAYDNQRTYLGLMSGDSIDNLTPVSIQGNRVNFSNFPRTYLSIWKRRFKMFKTCLRTLF